MTIERAFNFKHCGTGNVAVRTRQSQRRFAFAQQVVQPVTQPAGCVSAVRSLLSGCSCGDTAVVLKYDRCGV